jgi:isopentenyldiphosphate isomerase
MSRIAVVDDADRFVRWEERRVVHERQLPHRSVHILVFDSAARLVVQLRHATKQTWPRYWDTSVSGHVDEGDYVAGLDAQLDEVYARAARRELDEELGLSTPLELLGHFAPEPGIHYEQYHLYRSLSDGPFVFPSDEIEAVRALTAAQLDALEPVTPSLRAQVAWLRSRGLWG